MILTGKMIAIVAWDVYFVSRSEALANLNNSQC